MRTCIAVCRKRREGCWYVYDHRVMSTQKLDEGQYFGAVVHQALHGAVVQYLFRQLLVLQLDNFVFVHKHAAF